MTKKFTILTLGALGIVSLTSACTMEAAMEAPADETVGTSEEALTCSNREGTYSLMADIAANAGRELGRWSLKTSTKAGDLDYDYSKNAIVLTQQGIDRCKVWPTPATSNDCFYLKNSLSYQSWDMHGAVIHGTKFDFNAWGSKSSAAWGRQMTCLSRPDNGRADNCPAEAHDLKFMGVSAGQCGAGSLDYKFQAVKPGTNTILPAADAAQLANLLTWAGWGVGERNPWLAFRNTGADVSIDPTPNNEGGTTQTQGDVTLLSYHYQGSPLQYEIFPSTDLATQGKPCKANPAICTVGSGQSCPSVVKYFKKKPMKAQYECVWNTPTG